MKNTIAMVHSSTKTPQTAIATAIAVKESKDDDDAFDAPFLPVFVSVVMAVSDKVAALLLVPETVVAVEDDRVVSVVVIGVVVVVVVAVVVLGSATGIHTAFPNH